MLTPADIVCGRSLKYPGLVVCVESSRRKLFAPILKALQMDGAWQTSDPKSAEGMEDGVAGSRRLDLRSSTDLQGEHAYFLIVEEGRFAYRIGTEAMGWGSVISRSTLAKVTAVINSPEGFSQIGEVSLRLDPARPLENAARLVEAGAVLVDRLQQLGPTAGVPYAPTLAHPCPTIQTRLRCRFRRAISSARYRLRPTRLQWSIGIARGEQDPRKPLPWQAIRWIEPPKHGFIADPFLAHDGPSTWLFYERLLVSENKGTLWVGRLDADSLDLVDTTEILNTQFHLSFPNVFKSAENWYMLPEQARAGNTSLYVATEFPRKWRQAQILLPNFPGIDPVLLFSNGRWWLFVTHGQHPCSEDNLYLFSASELVDQFIPHPQNPIRSGLFGSRMAGPIINRNSELFRLGQDCRKGYGRGIVILKILTLSMDAYHEEVVMEWSSDGEQSYSEGLHSFMSEAGLMVIDGQRSIKA